MEVLLADNSNKSKIDEICPLAIPLHIPTISMHIPKFGDNPLIFTKVYLLKLSSGKENTYRQKDV